MSLVRIAIRVALVEALKGQTAVGDTVADSMIGALDLNRAGDLATEQERPFIAVYTDAAKAEGDRDLRSLKENGLTEIELEWGVATAMFETDREKGETVVVGIGIVVTDSALEFQLDLVGRQIADTLTDPENAWAEIARDLSFRFDKIERARTAGGNKGDRIAAHRLKITAQLADDPVIGEPMPEPFTRLFALMDASGDPDLAAKSAIMQAQLAGTAEEWQILRRRFGMTAPELMALGRGPLAVTEAGAVPVLEEVTLDVPGHGTETVTE